MYSCVMEYEDYYVDIGLKRKPSGSWSEVYKEKGIDPSDNVSTRKYRGVAGLKACPLIWRGNRKVKMWWETNSYKKLWSQRWRSIKNGTSLIFPGVSLDSDSLAKKDDGWIYFESLDPDIEVVWSDIENRQKFCELMEWRYEYEKLVEAGTLKPEHCVDFPYAYGRCFHYLNILNACCLPLGCGRKTLKESEVTVTCMKYESWADMCELLQKNRESKYEAMVKYEQIIGEKLRHEVSPEIITGRFR